MPLPSQTPTGTDPEKTIRVECEVVRDDLTIEERKALADKNAANREGGFRPERLHAATAKCLRCSNQCRGVGRTRARAERAAIERVGETCQKGNYLFSSDEQDPTKFAMELNTYVKRPIPPGCVLQWQHTNGKWFTRHVIGWAVCAACGEISKVVPLRLVAQEGCEPDPQVMHKFATRLANRGYRISLPNKGATRET